MQTKMIATFRVIDLPWRLAICREGCTNPFVLHLSLQSASGRMFVQASEVSGCSACLHTMHTTPTTRPCLTTNHTV